MSAALSFVAVLAVIAMTVVGFIATISIVLSWLDHRQMNSPSSSLDRITEDAEGRMGDLQSDAIGDMFDVVRKIQFERRIKAQS